MDNVKSIRLVSIHVSEFLPVMDAVFDCFLSNEIPAESYKLAVQNMVNKHELTLSEFVEVFILHSTIPGDSIEAEKNLEKFIIENTKKMNIEFKKE